MVARIAQKPTTHVRRRIEKVLADLHMKHFGVGAKVQVKDRGYKNYLDLFVTSPKFRGIPLPDRASLVGGWLRKGLSHREYSRIASLLPLTPVEERKLPTNGH